MGSTKTFIYRDNTGGTNLRSNEANLNSTEQRTEFSYIQNMDIYREGGFSSQQGNTQLNTSVTDTAAILGIGEYKTSSSTYAVYVKASGKAYVMASTGGTETEIKTGLSTTATPQFIQFNGKIICFNGVDQPWSWNGTSAANLTGTPAAWSSTKPTCASVFGGKRIFAGAGSTVYYCALGNENDWTTSSDAGSFSDVFGDATSIVAISDYGPRLVIHTAKPGVYLLSGSSPADYIVQPISSNRAATSKLGVATINDFQFFYSGDGILPIFTTDLGVFKLGRDQEISFKIKPFFTGTEREMPLNPVLTSANSKVILLPNYKNNQLIAYFKTTGNTYFDTAAIYNFDSGNWVFRKATVVSAAAKVNDNVLTGTFTGKILQEFYGTTVVSGSFQKKILSPFFDFGAPHLNKRVTRCYFWFKSSTDLNVTMKVRTDFETNIKHTRQIQSEGNSTSGAYGFGAYGVTTYASSSFLDINFPLNIVGKSFQFELESAISTIDFRLIQYGFEVEYLDSY